MKFNKNFCYPAVAELTLVLRVETFVFCKISII